MSSYGLGEMFQGDSADRCAGKFQLVSMGGRSEGQACADPGARTPIGASRNLYINFLANNRDLNHKYVGATVNFIYIYMLYPRKFIVEFMGFVPEYFC